MPPKIHHVLLVDDDPLVLRGFRRSIDAYSTDLDVDFALSGPEALVKLAQKPFDVLVADMHMPGMDGLQLLDRVSRERPEVIRFIMVGNAGDDQILKSAGLAHQTIPKHFDMERIFFAVKRACRLREQLSDPNLLRMIATVKTLPSVPRLYNQLVQVLESPDSSAQAVGNIIAQDAAMTAKILQLVNSAFFNLTDKVSNPQKAVTLLGLNTVKALVLGVQVFSEFQGRKGLPFAVDAIWKHSLLVSSLAYTIAKSLDLSPQEKEDVRVSGILHDIGILLYYKIPVLTSRIRFNLRGLVSSESEYQAFGTSHAEMGCYMLGIWGLPPSIVDAVAFHHKPWLQDPRNVNLVTVLYIANSLLNMVQFDKEAKYPAYLDLNYLEQLGLTGCLDEWLFLAKDQLKQSGSF